MKTILDSIIEQKQKEVQDLKRNKTIKDFEKSPYFERETFSLANRLNENFGIIAEIKRKSPSAGEIKVDLDPSEIALKYQNSGVSGISVLTDSDFFGAKENDLELVREVVDLPILRKDFIIDEIQIFQAKAMGADVILLIAEALTSEEIKHFTLIGQGLGMEVICEFHEKNQYNKISDLVDIIGVNNRNLKLQKTSLETSIEAIDFLPKDRLIISESGITSSEDLFLLNKIGYNGVLVGESILKNDGNINLKLPSNQFVKSDLC